MKRLMTIIVVLSFAMLLLAQSSCKNDKPASESFTGEAETGDKAGVGITEEVNEGAAIYQKNCKVCHGAEGKGDIGPDLGDSEWRYGSTDADLYYSIAKGRPGGMPNWEYKLGEEKIRKVMAYIRSISER